MGCEWSPSAQAVPGAGKRRPPLPWQFVPAVLNKGSHGVAHAAHPVVEEWEGHSELHHGARPAGPEFRHEPRHVGVHLHGQCAGACGMGERREAQEKNWRGEEARCQEARRVRSATASVVGWEAAVPGAEQKKEKKERGRERALNPPSSSCAGVPLLFLRC